MSKLQGVLYLRNRVLWRRALAHSGVGMRVCAVDAVIRLKAA